MNNESVTGVAGRPTGDNQGDDEEGEAGTGKRSYLPSWITRIFRNRSLAASCLAATPASAQVAKPVRLPTTARSTRHVWPDVPNSDEIDVFEITEDGIVRYEVRRKGRVTHKSSKREDAIEAATKLSQPSETDYQSNAEVVDEPTPNPSDGRNLK